MKPWERDWSESAQAESKKPWERDWSADQQPAPAATATAEPEPSNLTAGLWNKLGNHMGNIADATMIPGRVQAYDGMPEGRRPPTVAGEKLTRIGGAIGGGIQDIGDTVMKSAGATYDRLAPKGLKYMVNKAGELGGKIMEAPKRKLGAVVAPAMERYEAMPEGEKEYTKDLGNILLGAADVIGVGAAKKKIGSEVTQESIESYGRSLAKEMGKKSGIDEAIEKGISKGIKPTVLGKQTYKRVEDFYDRANQAVKTIAENRNLISLVDDSGETIVQPRNVIEMAQAIDQTKKVIYKKYHDMAVSAGDGGAKFNVKAVTGKLDEVTGNLKHSPQTRNYAETLKNEIAELAGQPPEIIEARIADLNSSLAGYYEGRVNKARAQLDASVASLMREELDDNIMKAGGEGYQDLKNQYGALKSIEAAVNKRAVVNARRASKSVIDFTDIFTGGDLAAGILTGNPALLMRGAAGKGIKEVYKKLNDPDRYIKKMFDAAYKGVPAASFADDVIPEGSIVKELLEAEAQNAPID
jgi:hypothetical protein